MKGVQLSLSGLRPGMVYRVQIVGISSDGVRGAPSMVIFYFWFVFGAVARVASMADTSP